MKQELHKPKTNCQTRLDIVNAKSRKSSILFDIPSNDGISDIFLIRNKGNGPPGRTLDSGMAYCLIRDDKLIVFGTSHTEPVEASKIPIENESIIHINKSKFLTQLNFTIMKKQILFLMFFVLALLTSVSTSFGQAPNLTAAATCPTPVVVNTTCLSADALHPVPGTAYDYTVVVPTPSGGAFTYHWLVTQDKTLIDATGLVATAEVVGANHVFDTGTGYNDPATGGATINITWSSFTHDASNPVFLVIYVENTVTCQTDNIELYIIEPKHAFTLDIANIGIDGSAQAANYATCVSPVVSAVYDGTQVVMDYGVNYLFFAVTAANFTGSWQPRFEIGGAGITAAGTTREVTAVEWAYPAEALTGTWNVTAGSGTAWTAAGAAVTNVAAKVGTTVGTAGECIIVRVTLDNNKAETIIDAPISLAVDGTMIDPATSAYATALYKDIHNADCSEDGFTNDIATQVISARPDINATTPTPFVTQDKD